MAAIRSVSASLALPCGLSDLRNPQVPMALTSIFAAMRPPPAAPDTTDRIPLEQIRHQMHQTLHDCKSVDAQRIIFRINTAPTPADLWLLRSDLYQCISRTRDQAEATRRINALLGTFSGWLPAAQLTPI